MMESHFEEISREVKRAYDVAGEARKKGLDPFDDVETPIAITLAEKTVGLISVIYPQLQKSGIVERILELEKEYGQLTVSVCLGIAEDIARQKFCKFNNELEAIDAAIRVAFSYFTLGVVSSPIEGYTGLKLGKTMEGKDYFKAYFSGPIRSAGTTASCVVLMVIDYLRETFGYAKYDPTEEEVKRYVAENYDYHERVTNLQYLPTEEEIVFLAKNLPIQIAGEPTEKREVYNYKDLKRVETNYIRGGMCLIFSEGLAQKAAKGYRLLKIAKENGFKSTGWDFLEEYVEKVHKKKAKAEGDGLPTYIKDIVAGRPIYSHPGRSGGFRFRYGRSRTSGFSATSVHPATMAISKSFLAVGTQLKIEKPTKGCALSMVEQIEGPIVKLKNGSVIKPKTLEEGAAIKDLVEEIIYLGDLLFPLGDVINRNSVLLKPGYVEEWWNLELKKAGGEVENFYEASFDDAVELSKKYSIPLHPKYIYYWTQINYGDFLALVDWIAHGERKERKLILPYNNVDKERFARAKRALELIGCLHEVTIENAVLKEDEAKAVLFSLGIKFDDFTDGDFDELIKKVPSEGEVLEVINGLAKAKIKDKAGDFIGARMGRPEKAKLRKLTGSPHVLFPVGNEGGRLRSMQAAIEAGSVKSDFPYYHCEECNSETVYPRCENCGGKCEKKYTCFECGNTGEKCKMHERGGYYYNRRIDIRHYFESAKKLVGARIEELPAAVKGIRGTSSEGHDCENLAKGLIRAKYNLHVNKDGTIRYDMTEMPLLYFKPKEIGTGIEKLKELGYNKDIKGNNLENENQILEIFPHDIVLPACPDTLDEKADDVFLRVSGFIDDELKYIYGLETFFNARKKDDLIGSLFACIAPHICTATVGRLIGFSKTQAFFASPFMHAAMRRDCLTSDNYVSINENGTWRILKIGDYIESEKPAKVLDAYGTLGKKMNNVKIWSNPGECQIGEITKHNPTDIIKISLEDGRKIRTTKDHKVFLKGKIMKEAKDVSVGDELMVSYKKNVGEKDIPEIFLPEIFKDRKDIMIRNVWSYLRQFETLNSKDYGNFILRDSFPIIFVKSFLEKYGKTFKDLPRDAKIAVKRDNVGLPLSINLEKEFLEVLGLYIAEGHARKNISKKGFYQISIAGNGEIRDFIRNVFWSYLELKPTHENDESITFSSRILYEIFKDYLKIGHNARTKRIPYIFLNLKKDKIAGILRGYFEGGGSASLSDIRITCDTVSEGLKNDLSFVLSRFGIYTKFYEYEKEPGQKLKDFYIRKKRAIPRFKITKIIILSNFVIFFREIGFLSKRKNEILEIISKKKPYGTKIDFDESYAYPKVKSIEYESPEITYCFNVMQEHNFFANDILVKNCDGDEIAVILLMDMLLNFSKKFLPSHRGGTQDAPLVLNTRINAGEVDDQILDVISGPYTLELYELAEERKHSSEIKIERIADRLKKGEDPFSNLLFTHDCDNINHAVLNSSYKLLPTMAEKVAEQMDLCSKIRAVDTSDVARLIIERHFIRDIRGNLRKFSQQVFRCVACNTKFRRPPLAGKCTACGGKIIFTISEGSIIKYMQAALDLARKYHVSPYLLENLEIVEKDIESIFGKEKEKQENLARWFG